MTTAIALLMLVSVALISGFMGFCIGEAAGSAQQLPRVVSCEYAAVAMQ